MKNKKITTKELNKLIGHRIKFFRELRGKKQSALAKELGYMSTGAISRIEKGDIGMKKSNVATAARALSISPFILTTEEYLTDKELIIVNDFIDLLKQPDNAEIIEKFESFIKAHKNK
jgi:transcriptional regulator with XRE-family HTH domain